LIAAIFFLALNVSACLTMFHSRVSHSTVAIIKPMPKIEIPSKEVEEAMKKVKEAQSLISGAVESGEDMRHKLESGLCSC
jgi:hypothetical protein